MAVLDMAAFSSGEINERQAETLIDQGEELLERARRLAHGWSRLPSLHGRLFPTGNSRFFRSQFSDGVRQIKSRLFVLSKSKPP